MVDFNPTAVYGLLRPMSNLSLYNIENDLQAFVDTDEGGVSPEQVEEFKTELAARHDTAIAKRDRVAQFLTHCVLQAENAKAEIERLTARKNMFERAKDRVSEYVIEVIKSLGQDDKGRWRKLEGKTSTLRIQRNPTGVKITDEAKVPAAAKKITVTMFADDWERLLTYAPPKELAGILQPIDLDRKPKVEVQVLKSILSEMLEVGEVSGAEWAEEEHHLRRS